MEGVAPCSLRGQTPRAKCLYKLFIGHWPGGKTNPLASLLTEEMAQASKANKAIFLPYDGPNALPSMSSRSVSAWFAAWKAFWLGLRLAGTIQTSAGWARPEFLSAGRLLAQVSAAFGPFKRRQYGGWLRDLRHHRSETPVSNDSPSNAVAQQWFQR